MPQDLFPDIRMDPPFIKLPSTQSPGSGASSSSKDNGTTSSTSFPGSTVTPTLPTSPLSEPGTHNTTRARYHIKDIGQFANALEISANRALPKCGLTRYKQTKVLLLRWEEDELQVEWELEDLGKVFQSYGFDTETWLIPTESPLRKVMSKVISFIEDYENDDTLFILYYGGHATINSVRQSTWSCKRDINYSSFEWTGCQNLLEQSKSDILILLDCCSAAAAAGCLPCHTNSITETIAACGWETWTPEPGRHSFTNALFTVLEDWVCRNSFSAAMLHSEVLSVLKQPRPRRNREISKTPVYIVTTSNPKACSIEIARCNRNSQPQKSQDVAVELENGIFPSSTSGPGNLKRAHSPDNGTNIRQKKVSKLVDDGNQVPKEGQAESSSLPSTVPANHGAFDLSSYLATLPDKSFALPHVIISVALESEQELDANAFAQWIKQFPALARYARIQGIYRGYSTFILAAIPVFIWNLLSENYAYNFVGYVRSDNLLGANQPHEATKEGIPPTNQHSTLSVADPSLTPLTSHTEAIETPFWEGMELTNDFHEVFVKQHGITEQGNDRLQHNLVQHFASNNINGISISESELLNNELSKVKNDLCSLKDKAGQMNDEVNYMKDEVSHMKDEFGDVKDEVGNVKGEAGDVKDEIGKMKNEVYALKYEISMMKEQISRLRERLSQAEGRSFNRFRYLPWHDIAGIGVFRPGVGFKTSEYFPTTIKDFCSLKLPQNVERLISLVQFYGIDTHKYWEWSTDHFISSETSNSPRPTLLLEDAIRKYPLMAMEELAAQIGIDMSKIQNSFANSAQFVELDERQAAKRPLATVDGQVQAEKEGQGFPRDKMETEDSSTESIPSSEDRRRMKTNSKERVKQWLS